MIKRLKILSGLVLLAHLGYSQETDIDKLKREFQVFSFDSSRRIATAEELPASLWKALKKSFPTKKSTPLLSKDEFKESLRKESESSLSVSKRIGTKKPRIFGEAYSFRDYFVFDYYFTGRYRITRWVIVKWENNKIKLLLVCGDENINSLSSAKLKRYSDRIYLGNFVNEPDSIW